MLISSFHFPCLFSSLPPLAPNPALSLSTVSSQVHHKIMVEATKGLPASVKAVASKLVQVCVCMRVCAQVYLTVRSYSGTRGTPGCALVKGLKIPSDNVPILQKSAARPAWSVGLMGRWHGACRRAHGIKRNGMAAAFGQPGGWLCGV
jgi:hypothetical protein